MQFSIAIHKEHGTAYGVTVPDIPGCHSWGESIDDAIRNTEEAIRSHIAIRRQLGEATLFHASSTEELLANPEYAGAIWTLVEIDLTDQRAWEEPPRSDPV
jgi:predicted RNase H-like HicB family nuclease